MTGPENEKSRGVVSAAWNYLKNTNDQQRGGMAGYIGNAIVVAGALYAGDMVAAEAGAAAFVSDGFFLLNSKKRTILYSLGQLTGAAAVEMYRRSGAAGDNQALKYFMAAQVVLLSLGALRAPIEWMATRSKSPRVRRLKSLADRIPGAIGFTMPWIRIGVLLASWNGLNGRMALSQAIYCYADILRGSTRDSFIAAKGAMTRKKAKVQPLRPANDVGVPSTPNQSSSRDVA